MPRNSSATAKRKKSDRSAKKTRRRTSKSSKCTPALAEAAQLKSLLFPVQAPSRRGFIKVSELHTVAYYTYGNPKGVPHLYLHGGPGGGINHSITDTFDLKKYFLVAIDQRGCGKSTPRDELRENDTQSLVSDIEAVRAELGVKKWVVVGFSWGSTLALYYAQQHADKVRGLLIGGVFTATKKETDYIENGEFVQMVFPRVWEKYASILKTAAEKRNPAKAYQNKVLGKDGVAEQKKAMRHYTEMEDAIGSLYPMHKHTKKSKSKSNTAAVPIERIFHHYFANNCFFPRDGYLLESRNMRKMAKIPVEIVQGQYDIVTPTIVAYQVHKKLPKSRIHMSVAGHQGRTYEFNKQVIDSLAYLSK